MRVYAGLLTNYHGNAVHFETARVPLQFVFLFRDCSRAWDKKNLSSVSNADQETDVPEMRFTDDYFSYLLLEKS